MEISTQETRVLIVNDIYCLNFCQGMVIFDHLIWLLFISKNETLFKKKPFKIKFFIKSNKNTHNNIGI